MGLVQVECSHAFAVYACTAIVLLVAITTQALAVYTTARVSIVAITRALAAIVMLLVIPKHILVAVQMAFPFVKSYIRDFI